MGVHFVAEFVEAGLAQHRVAELGAGVVIPDHILHNE
jgi:hypothetical protein